MINLLLGLLLIIGITFLLVSFILLKAVANEFFTIVKDKLGKSNTKGED